MIERRHIEKVIDLRAPATREWFFRFFRLGDGIVYKKDKGSNISGFYEMLPALMHINLGGFNETRGIGHWMRHSEVSALIFPSARCNVGVTVRGGEVIDYYGSI